MSVGRILGWTSAAVVAASVVAGLLILGTPDDERERRFDQRRLSDLQRLAMVVRLAYRRDGALPASLPPLVDGLALDRLPRDPRTDQPYGYRVEDEDHFELCAAFDRASEDPADGFWTHGAGRQCFSFESGREPADALLIPPHAARPGPASPAPGG